MASENIMYLLVATGLDEGAKDLANLLRERLSPEEAKVVNQYGFGLAIRPDGVSPESVPLPEDAIGRPLLYLTESDMRSYLADPDKNFSLLKFEVFLTALGNGPSSDNDWTHALRELAATTMVIAEASKIASEVQLLNGPRNKAAILARAANSYGAREKETLLQLVPNFSKTIEVYTTYLGFVRDQIEKMNLRLIEKQKAGSLFDAERDRILRGIDGIRFEVQGEISSEYIVDFCREIIEKWPLNVRRLLGDENKKAGHKGLIIRFSSQTGAIYTVNNTLVISEQYISEITREKKAQKLDPYLYEYYLHTACLTILGSPDTIDWGVLKTVLLEHFAKHKDFKQAGLTAGLNVEQISGRVQLLGSAAQLMKDRNWSQFLQNTSMLIMLVHAHIEYKSFLNNLIEEMNRQTQLEAEKKQQRVQDSLNARRDRILKYGIDGIVFQVEGAISSQDIVNFYNKIVTIWPENERKLLGKKGLQIVFGDQFHHHIASDGNRLLINQEFLNKMVENIAAGTFPGNMIENVKYAAFLAVLGEGPDTIDWKTARASALSYFRAKGDTQYYDAIMFTTPGQKAAYGVILQSALILRKNPDLRDIQDQYPFIQDLFDVEKQYLAFVAQQILAMNNPKGSGKSSDGDQNKGGPVTLPDEEKNRLRDAEIRRTEALLLEHKKYGLTDALETLKARATGRRQEPQAKLQAAWRESEPLTENLNRNFAPHLRLGDLLFLNENAHTLAVLNYLCAVNTTLPDMNASIRISVQDQLILILSESARSLAPVMKSTGMQEELGKANDSNHQRVQQNLLNAPLLIIAALGTEKIVNEAREVHTVLFPASHLKQPDADDIKMCLDELRTLANTALRNAFVATGKPIPDYVQAVIAPPEPPIYRSQIDINATRLSDDALRTLLKPLLAAAETRGAEYKDRGFNQYSCHLALASNPYQLHHFFANTTSGEREEWAQSLGTDNLDAAVDIHIAIQSQLLNSGFQPLRHGGRDGGVISITTKDVMPYMAPDSDAVHVSSSSNGYYYLHFEARDRINGEPIRFSMPLGVAEGANTLEEAHRRRDLVMALLKTAREQEKFITKGVVTDYLRAHCTAWDVPQYVFLPGYEETTLITDKHGQRLTLGSVALHEDVSPDCPTWICTFRLYLESESGRCTMRPHSLRLHTSSQDLALERAAHAVQELLQVLGNREEPWALEASQLARKDYEYLEQLYYSIRRYEGDIRVVLENQTETDAHVDFTLRAMRCWIAEVEKGDSSFLEPVDIAKKTKKDNETEGDTKKALLEPMDITKKTENDTKAETEPVALTFRVPKEFAHFIPNFAHEVHLTFSSTLGAIYCPVALPTTAEQETTPRLPKTYQRFHAPMALIKACSQHESSLPGLELVKGMERFEDMCARMSSAQGGSKGIGDIRGENERRNQSRDAT